VRYITAQYITAQYITAQYITAQYPNLISDALFDLCDLLHSANCTERVVALLQSMIEFNLYRPVQLESASHKISVEKFQEFYETG